MSKHDYVFVMFYAEWCPHSKEFKPEYEKLATRYTEAFQNSKVSSEVKFAKIQGDRYNSVSAPFGVEGFPAFKMIIKGSIKSYPAKVNLETMYDWLNALFVKRPKHIMNSAEINEILDKKGIIKVFRGDDASDNWKNIVNLNYILFNYEGVYQTKEESVINEFELVEDNRLFIIKKVEPKANKEGIVEISQKTTRTFIWQDEYKISAINKWIALATIPVYKIFSDFDEVNQIFGHDTPILALFTKGESDYFDNVIEKLENFF